MLKQKAGGGVLTVTDAVKNAFRDIGKDRRTNGDWKHAIKGFIFEILPTEQLNPVLLGHMKKSQLAREAAKYKDQ